MDHFGIPSSQKLIELDASPLEDIVKFKGKISHILEVKLEKDVEILSNHMLGKNYSQEHIDKTC